MQKIGRKSIVVETTVLNESNPQSPKAQGALGDVASPFVVKVQANKNYGICDIIVGSKIPQEVVDEKTKKKKTIMRFFPVRRVGDVLSSFQGRQYNDPKVFELLEDALHVSLNTL